MFFNYDGIKIENSDRRKFGKFTNRWKSNSILLMGQCQRRNFIRKIRKYFSVNENKNTMY